LALVLTELVGPAMMTLKDLLEDPDTPPAVRATVARDILDRTGHKPPPPLPPGAWDQPPPLHVFERWITDLEAEEATRARLESSTRPPQTPLFSRTSSANLPHSETTGHD
jgi:hypothetical protein